MRLALIVTVRVLQVSVLLCLLVLLLKAGQFGCRVIRLAPPASLESWDPIDRIQAAQDAAYKYGGKK